VTQLGAGASLTCWMPAAGTAIQPIAPSGLLTSNHAAATVHPLATDLPISILPNEVMAQVMPNQPMSATDAIRIGNP
ncbi:MAG: hypothetical protein ACK6A7_09085, partial [Planctomycetota bacterium]